MANEDHDFLSKLVKRISNQSTPSPLISIFNLPLPLGEGRGEGAEVGS
jgi:hypothetical protein